MTSGAACTGAPAEIQAAHRGPCARFGTLQSLFSSASTPKCSHQEDKAMKSLKQSPLKRPREVRKGRSCNRSPFFIHSVKKSLLQDLKKTTDNCQNCLRLHNRHINKIYSPSHNSFSILQSSTSQVQRKLPPERRHWLHHLTKPV